MKGRQNVSYKDDRDPFSGGIYGMTYYGERNKRRHLAPSEVVCLLSSTFRRKPNFCF